MTQQILQILEPVLQEQAKLTGKQELFIAIFHCQLLDPQYNKEYGLSFDQHLCDTFLPHLLIIIQQYQHQYFNCTISCGGQTIGLLSLLNSESKRFAKLSNSKLYVKISLILLPHAAQYQDLFCKYDAYITLQLDFPRFSSLVAREWRGPRGQTMLMCALRCKSSLFENFINQGNLIDSENNLPLAYAAIADYQEGMLVFRKQIGNQDKQGKCALMFALKFDSIVAEEFLMKHEKHIVDYQGNTVLMYAAQKGRINVAKQLKSQLMRQNNHGDTALILALQHKHFQFARLCFDECAIVNQSGVSPLKITLNMLFDCQDSEFVDLVLQIQHYLQQKQSVAPQIQELLAQVGGYDFVIEKLPKSPLKSVVELIKDMTRKSPRSSTQNQITPLFICLQQFGFLDRVLNLQSIEKHQDLKNLMGVQQFALIKSFLYQLRSTQLEVNGIDVNVAVCISDQQLSYDSPITDYVKPLIVDCFKVLVDEHGQAQEIRPVVAEAIKCLVQNNFQLLNDLLTVNIIKNYGINFVEFSIKNQIVSNFLRFPQLFEQRDEQQSTVLMLAAAADFNEGVVNFQHQINQINSQGDTALMIALRNRSFLTPLLLIEEAGKINNKGETALTLLYDNFESYKDNWILIQKVMEAEGKFESEINKNALIQLEQLRAGLSGQNAEITGFQSVPSEPQNMSETPVTLQSGFKVL